MNCPHGQHLRLRLIWPDAWKCDDCGGVIDLVEYENKTVALTADHLMRAARAVGKPKFGYESLNEITRLIRRGMEAAK